MTDLKELSQMPREPIIPLCQKATVQLKISKTLQIERDTVGMLVQKSMYYCKPLHAGRT